MNNSPIPKYVLKAARAWLYRMANGRDSIHGQVAAIPAYAPEGITTGTGYFKAGLRVWIIGGTERTIFLGSDRDLRETVIPEFTLLTESGSQRLCQYGRDFRFKDAANAA